MNTHTHNESINVIIADDHPIFRFGLKEIIGKIPLVKDIAEATDGFEVLAHLQQKQYRLIFMDYNMPGMNGETATRLVTERYPGVYVIALTMHEEAFTVRRMFDAGCSAYVIKKSMKNELTNAIMKVLSGKKYFSDEIAEKLSGNSEVENLEQLRHKFTLTATELKLIRLICAGRMNKQIAEEMNISIRTVEKYRTDVFHKIGINNSVGLMHFAIRHHIISLENI